MATLAELKTSLAYWEAAADAAAKGEDLRWEGRSLKPQPPAECRRMITYYERKIRAIESGRPGHSTSLARFS